MHFSENLKQSFQSLKSNKLRSILTMIGIIMGVFSIVAIMAIGNAAKSFMEAEFNKLGANVLMIQYQSSQISNRDELTMKDMDVLIEGIPEIQNISAFSADMGTLKIGDKTRSASVIGASSQYTSFQVMEISEGRFINEEDVESNRKVVFVNDLFAKRYFDKTDVVGEEIRLTNDDNNVLRLKIIGVQSTENELFAEMGDNEDYPVSIIIPITTMHEFYGTDMLNRIDLSIIDKNQLKEIGDRLIKLLEFTHQNKDKYAVTSVQDIQASVGKVLGVITTVLLVIAVITLVVGGIGIINILLVSVTERIREIGIRKALGARKKDIVLQFLTESIMMTGISGLIGILLGIICGAIISSIIKIPPVVDLKTIVFAFFGSVILGIVFGVYPAKKAADLNPIDALRYE